ncbi:MAG: hypothetical protein JW870_02915 [Candidatus Delongbacteria bacterium]|nr:hypothetical protein [Candidatus Delongbacteria bacterium]
MKPEVKYQIKELRQIIRTYDLIPGVPSDEFDSLVHQLISHLYKGSSQEKIRQVIYSELITSYGLDVEIEETEEIAEYICNWWTDQII